MSNCIKVLGEVVHSWKKKCIQFSQLRAVELLLLLLLDGGSAEPWEEQRSHSRAKRHKQRLSQEGKGSLERYQI